MRETIGLDTFDVSTDATGAAAVSAGSFLSNSTCVGIKQGIRAGSSRVVIDHDLTEPLKARGEIGSDGNSKLVFGVEWDCLLKNTCSQQSTPPLARPFQ